MQETGKLHQPARLALTPAAAGALLMVMSAACWGMGTVMSKAALGVFPAMPLLVTQLVASVTVLWLATLLVRAPFHARLFLHGWSGLLEPGLAYILGSYGLLLTSASNASIIGTLEPVMVMAIAAVFLREVVPGRAWLLAMLALGGTIIVSTAQSGTGGGTASVAGDALELAAVGAAALYVVFSRRSVFDVHPVPLAASQHTFGLGLALAALAVSSLAGGAPALDQVTTGEWLFAALTGVVQYASAFLCYLFALQRLPAARAALFLLLIPVFGFAGSVVFLGESLSVTQLAGSAVIVCALILLQRVHARH